MSERYGDCPSCLGHGSVKTETGVIDETTGVREIVQEECFRCGGTGMNGEVQ
jgi:hypothetical protein